MPLEFPRKHNAPLSDDDIRAIRSLRNVKTQKELAEMYGRTQPVISQILNRWTYQHVPDDDIEIKSGYENATLSDLWPLFGYQLKRAINAHLPTNPENKED